jgi:hypothetical protein
MNLENYWDGSTQKQSTLLMGRLTVQRAMATLRVKIRPWFLDCGYYLTGVYIRALVWWLHFLGMEFYHMIPRDVFESSIYIIHHLTYDHTQIFILT